jgi:hypothetical protein
MVGTDLAAEQAVELGGAGAGSPGRPPQSPAQGDDGEQVDPQRVGHAVVAGDLLARGGQRPGVRRHEGDVVGRGTVVAAHAPPPTPS